MANTTPSQSIKLGANLQEQLGDLKGAAKTLNDEARAAQVEVRAAQREIKELERRKKKGEDVNLTPAVNRKLELERKIEVKKQKATDLKERAKEDQQFKKEVDKRLGGFERRASSQLYGVKDSLNMVSKRLIQTNNGIAQTVGKSIGAVSAKITPGMISGVARVAGPVGIAIGVGASLIAAERRFHKQGKAFSEVQGASAENVRRVAQGFVTREMPKEFMSSFNQIGEKAGIRAAQDIAKQDVIDYDFGQILKYAGAAGKTEKELRVEKRRAERVDEQLNLIDVAEKYGQSFADKNTLDAIKNSPEVQKAWRRKMQEDYRISILGQGLFEKFTGWTAAEEALGKEDFITAEATRIQAGTITAKATGRAQAKATAAQDPAAEAERHMRSSRRNGLERQRLRREMQWNKF